jgi:RNA polymerase sigma-70 factor, ECF subfamily
MTEQELIQSAQMGDLESFNQLILEYQNLVYRQAYYMLHDHDRAEDISQESFLKAFNHLPSYRGGSFRSWLLQITTRTCLDELRSQKRRQTFPFSLLNRAGEAADAAEAIPQTGCSVEETVERFEVNRVLRQHLEKLDPKYRSVIVLTDLQGIQYEEAAEILGIPVGTLKSRLVRARRLLSSSLHRVPELCLRSGYA